MIPLYLYYDTNPPKAIKLNNAPLLYIAELRVHNIEMLRLYVFTYDTVSDVVESKVHQCQQNSDA